MSFAFILETDTLFKVDRVNISPLTFLENLLIISLVEFLSRRSILFNTINSFFFKRSEL